MGSLQDQTIALACRNCVQVHLRYCKKVRPTTGWHASPRVEISASVNTDKSVGEDDGHCYSLLEAVRENEEVVPVNVSTWVLLLRVTVGR